MENMRLETDFSITQPAGGILAELQNAAWIKGKLPFTANFTKIGGLTA